MNNKIRIGMVGGGPGAMIAESHRIAIRLDNRFDLVAGSFSRDPEKNKSAGRANLIDPSRIYADHSTMIETESSRSDGIQAVSIVTPNDSHYKIAKECLLKGLHVIIDKPLTDDIKKAEELLKISDEKNLILCLTHNYTGYGMVREAASIVRAGELGEINSVSAEHLTGWANKPLEKDGHRQALWRTDPSQVSMAAAMYDLGTHAHHLLRYVTGLEVTELSAEMRTNIKDRQVYDEGRVIAKLSNGAGANIWASMTATGIEHGLSIRVFGTKASLEWRHEDPQHLVIKYSDCTRKILSHGQPGAYKYAGRYIRVGIGHVEGFLAAFANLYLDFANAIEEVWKTGNYQRKPVDFPDAKDGLEGVRFVQATLDSHNLQSQWVKLQ